ncbi:MAG: hypothetical protein NTZ05_17140 [Chloroflexi bacterium]|nr:hypothetical protein [Chloroflexota bacterium]
MEKLPRGDMRFWGAWGLAFAGFPLGGLAAQAIVGRIDTLGAAVAGGALTGAVVGAAQWLALRRRIPLSPAWIAATSLGMAGGLALGQLLLGSDTATPALLTRALLTGAAIGGVQTALLWNGGVRQPLWGPFIALCWAVGWTITQAVGVDLTLKWTVFGSSGAVTFQLLTGLGLAWMLRGAAAFESGKIAPQAEGA